jgi:hypothetical protein
MQGKTSEKNAKQKRPSTLTSNKIQVLFLFASFVVKPVDQELASIATPEPIQNNNIDIIETDKSTTSSTVVLVSLPS